MTLRSSGRATLAGIATIIALMAPAVAGAEPTLSELAAISNGGVMVGSLCAPECAGYEAAYFRRDGVRRIGTLGGFAAIFGDINDNGVGVGQADTAAFDPSGTHVSHAFISRGFGMRSLGTLQGYAHSQAYGVDAHGRVVGWSYNLDPATGAPIRTFRGFVTAPAGGRMRDLGTLGGATTIARDITDDGRIVGSSETADGTIRAFRYQHGVMTELPSLGGSFAEATAINERGDIVGSANRPGEPNNRRRAVLWDRHGIHDLGTLGGPQARAWQINARGEIAGQAQTGGLVTHAVVWHKRTIRDLGTLGGERSFAFGINDAGTVVGVSETGVIDPDLGPISHGFVVRRGGAMRDVTP